MGGSGSGYPFVGMWMVRSTMSRSNAELRSSFCPAQVWHKILYLQPGAYVFDI